ncbi:alpha/beta hydrolase family protein [Aestuariimicrobium sp. Y1814]|uniref:alpha/beta hydrolase family protein n=1 Tax=Aestuariimicrobium sp. Y1814 TaxID=3418742 RepID=UPI003DA70FA8
MTTTRAIEVDTPQGPGRWLVEGSRRPGAPRALLLLGHGAGGATDSIDLLALAGLLPDHGVSVARFQQPWRLAGRKVATRPPTLDEAWLAAVPALQQAPGLGLEGVPLVSGGHSAGARVACRTAALTSSEMVLALSFPLHPPGKPDTTRLDELLTPTVPVLVLQGERDPFGSATEVRAAVAGAGHETRVRVVEVTGAAHALSVPARVRSAEEHRAWLVATVLDGLGWSDNLGGE